MSHLAAIIGFMPQTISSAAMDVAFDAEHIARRTEPSACASHALKRAGCEIGENAASAADECAIDARRFASGARHLCIGGGSINHIDDIGLGAGIAGRFDINAAAGHEQKWK
jgi:hypothetical protein